MTFSLRGCEPTSDWVANFDWTEIVCGDWFGEGGELPLRHSISHTHTHHATSGGVFGKGLLKELHNIPLHSSGGI